MKPDIKLIPTKRQQQIFNEYLISHNTIIAAKTLGISHSRVSHVIKLFGYKKPDKIAIHSLNETDFDNLIEDNYNRGGSYRHEYYIAHREHILERQHQQYITDPEKFRERNRKQRLDNHNKTLGYGRKWAANNREKLNKLNRTYKINNPDANRNTQLKRDFGISIIDYDELFNKQEGKCYLCGKHQSELQKRLCVDHDHITNKVRGLLCHHCNVMLGMSGDSFQRLRDGADYIEKHRNEFS